MLMINATRLVYRPIARGGVIYEEEEEEETQFYHIS